MDLVAVAFGGVAAVPTPQRQTVQQVMDRKTEGTVSRYIEREWRSLSADARPWGMWLTVHGPVPEDVDMLDRESSPAWRAWFLDEGGVRPRDVWAFRRFWAVLLVRSWCKRPFGEPDTMFSSHRHSIGWAAIAAYEETNDVYLEIIYGGLSGRGSRLVIGQCGDVREVELWRS